MRTLLDLDVVCQIPTNCVASCCNWRTIYLLLLCGNDAGMACNVPIPMQLMNDIYH